MDTINLVALWIRRAGGLAVFLTLASLFLGIFRGLHRPAGRVAGWAPKLLGSSVFYLLASAAYFGICYLLWQPVDLHLPPASRGLALSVGTLLFFSGLSLVLWGRLALGQMYYVSTGMGARLFSDHRLVTHGPYACVRHPIYLGILLTGLGGVLLYQTWTFVFLALHFPGLMLRARREEQVLDDEFGQAWQAYCRAVNAWLPLRKELTQKRGNQAMVEVGLLFLPAIPSYLWVWPNVTGASQTTWQSLTYLYVLAGTLYIGLRYYRPTDLGLSARGLWMSLIAGLVILAGRTLVIVSVDWGSDRPEFEFMSFLGNLIFYLILVGMGEELLFRGLIYRALEDSGGARLAIWGSSVGFMLWHIFGQGPLVGAAMLFYGLTFALIRWRAGGILGLILAHGWIDITAWLMLPATDVVGLGRPEIPHPVWMVLGLGLLVLLPIYLWKLYPLSKRLRLVSDP